MSAIDYELNEIVALQLIPRTVEPVWEFSEVGIGSPPKIEERLDLLIKLDDVVVVSYGHACEFFPLVEQLCVVFHFDF